MKSTVTGAILLMALFLIALTCNAQRLSNQVLNTQSLIKQINDDPRSTFRAKMYPKLDTTAKLINNARKSNNLNIKGSIQQKFISKGLPIPPEYDLRKVWPQCIGGIQNEGQCGAVWAMVPAATVSDRMCIQSNAKFQERLSTQYILECDKRDYGCNGGDLNSEFDFELRRGIPTETCLPYSAANGTLDNCRVRCLNGRPMMLYKIQSVQNITGEEDMQQAILQGGSILSEIDMYLDFQYYTTGVYSHSSFLGQPIAKFVVRIVGWGIQAGMKYWIVPNIWGKDWGMEGYILIRRGINEGNIEKNVFSFQVYQ